MCTCLLAFLSHVPHLYGAAVSGRRVGVGVFVGIGVTVTCGVSVGVGDNVGVPVAIPCNV